MIFKKKFIKILYKKNNIKCENVKYKNKRAKKNSF